MCVVVTREADAAALRSRRVVGGAHVVHGDQAVPVIREGDGMGSQRVADELVPRVRSRIGNDTVERGERPGHPAVGRIPRPPWPLGALVDGRLGLLGGARVVRRGRDGRADQRRTMQLRRRADAGEVAAVGGHRLRGLLGSRRPGEQCPRLRLFVDRSHADLPRPRIPAGKPAARHALPRDDREVARRGRAQLPGERLVAHGVRDQGKPGIDVRRLRGDEVRLGHLEELGREVAPVSRRAARAGQIFAVRPGAHHLLEVSEGELQVVPQCVGARPEVGDLAREEREVPRRERVLARRPEEPEVQVIRGAEVVAAASAHQRVRDRGDRGRLLVSGVRDHLARQPGIRPDHRQHVLQRVAEGALEPEGVLVVAALREDVPAADLFVRRARADEVGIPDELPREPRVRRAERRLREPGRPLALAGAEGVGLRPVATEKGLDLGGMAEAIRVAERDARPGGERDRALQREHRSAGRAARTRRGDGAGEMSRGHRGRDGSRSRSEEGAGVRIEGDDRGVERARIDRQGVGVDVVG